MKQFVKRIISILAYYTRLWHFLYFMRPKITGKHILAVVTFHRVIPKSKTKHLVANYDIGMDLDLYETYLNELNKYFDFISLDQFIDFAYGNKKLQANSILITFDDADSEFPDYALEILEKNKWPSVVFAPTDFMDSDKRFWHLRISNFMLNMDNEIWQKIVSIQFSLPESIWQIFSEYPIYDKSLYQIICRKLINGFNTVKDDEIVYHLNNIEKTLNLPYTLGINCMSWEQLKDISERGVLVQSHSVSHRKLEYLQDDEIKTEFLGSKDLIESKLGKEVKAFCYPAGSHNNRAAELAGQAGYKVAFTTENRIVNYPLDGLELFKITRISLSGKNKYEVNLEIGRLNKRQ